MVNSLDEAKVPLVSVLVPTYQHGPYIAQCLESIVGQVTNFPIEVIVGEDESNDGTRAECQRISAKYPTIVRLILRKRSDVLYIQGSPTGRANLLQLISEAKGTFIATCEGDDYWTDPNKLQRQVDFLRADPAYVAHTHNVHFTDERDEQDSERLFSEMPTRILTLKDVAPKRAYHTASLIFRREGVLNDKWSSAVKEFLSYDKYMSWHLLLCGQVYYDNTPMACYRRHGGGASTSPNLDRYFRSDVELCQYYIRDVNDLDKNYLADCIVYYKVELLRFLTKYKFRPTLWLDLLKLRMVRNGSEFLTSRRFKDLRRNLWWKTKAYLKGNDR